MAKLYKVDGTVVDVEPRDKQDGFQLKELYYLLNCDIVQPVCFMKGKWFICDEEGWLKPDAKRNDKVNEYIIGLTGDDWNVCGNVIICNDEEFK